MLVGFVELEEPRKWLAKHNRVSKNKTPWKKWLLGNHPCGNYQIFYKMGLGFDKSLVNIIHLLWTPFKGGSDSLNWLTPMQRTTAHCSLGSSWGAAAQVLDMSLVCPSNTLSEFKTIILHTVLYTMILWSLLISSIVSGTLACLEIFSSETGGHFNKHKILNENTGIPLIAFFFSKHFRSWWVDSHVIYSYSAPSCQFHVANFAQ